MSEAEDAPWAVAVGMERRRISETCRRENSGPGFDSGRDVGVRGARGIRLTLKFRTALPPPTFPPTWLSSCFLGACTEVQPAKQLQQNSVLLALSPSLVLPRCALS